MTTDPIFQATGLLASCALLICIRGRAASRFIGGTLLFAFVLTAINALFQTSGQTLLFTYLGGRRFTLEGVALGASMSVMFATIMILFAGYSAVMTTDKTTYLFGRFAPSVTIVLTMSLRNVPDLIHRAKEIHLSRKACGITLGSTPVTQRIRSASSELASMVSWAFDRSVACADSMRSRGFGSAKRTSYLAYPMDARSAFVLVLLVISFAIAFAFLATQDAYVSYLPTIQMHPLDALGWVAFAAFAAFFAIPLLLSVEEACAWRISASRVWRSHIQVPRSLLSLMSASR